MGILGMENMEAGFRGFHDAFKNYPDIKFLGKYDDKANVETAAKITADLLARILTWLALVASIPTPALEWRYR